MTLNTLTLTHGSGSVVASPSVDLALGTLPTASHLFLLSLMGLSYEMDKSSSTALTIRDGKKWIGPSITITGPISVEDDNIIDYQFTSAATDSSGNGYNGTIVNGTVSGGKYTRNTGGTDGGITIPTTGLQFGKTTSFSIETSIKWNDTNSGEHTITRGHYTNGGGYSCEFTLYFGDTRYSGPGWPWSGITLNPHIRLYTAATGYGGGGDLFWDCLAENETTNYHTYKITRAGLDFELFVDGVSKGAQSINPLFGESGVPSMNFTDFQIGGNTSNSYALIGTMDYFTIFEAVPVANPSDLSTRVVAKGGSIAHLSFLRACSLSSAFNYTIRDCGFVQGEGEDFALSLSNFVKARIESCSFDGPLILTNCEDLTLDSIHALSLQLINCKRIRVRNSTILGSTGIEIDADSSHCFFSNCLVTNSSTGIINNGLWNSFEAIQFSAIDFDRFSGAQPRRYSEFFGCPDAPPNTMDICIADPSNRTSILYPDIEEIVFDTDLISLTEDGNQLIIAADSGLIASTLTATDAQTIFVFDKSFNGSIIVQQNDQILLPTSYSQDSDHQITLLSGATTGDKIRGIGWPQ